MSASSRSGTQQGVTGEHLAALRSRVSAELSEPVRDSITWLANEIAATHGPTVLGVLFYGSCLRKETDEGVLDFWVIVDDYASAHSKPGHALLNGFAPPSVYYLEREYQDTATDTTTHTTLRTKYGVVDRRAFERGTSFDAWQPYMWARFAQPARLVVCRDDDAQAFFDGAVTNAVVTFVGRLFCHLPDQSGLLRFSLPAFWQEAFRRTYDSERRPEGEEYIRGTYQENHARYDAVATHAFHCLARARHLDEAMEHPRSFSISVDPKRLRLMRWRWRAMRALSRVVGLARLLKTTVTFGDWVPYALWKLEKHTGRKIELTPRQRKHPLIFAWPIIIPLLMRRNLR